jgi:hypothetical protein
MSSYRYGHPVIDSDGHFVEFFPAFVDYLKAEGGGEILERASSCSASVRNSTRIPPFRRAFRYCHSP